MSGALVCPFCSFVVVRTDRDLSLRGKVADLAPTQALLAVGARGRAGDTSFTVLGRLQLDHGAGPWDEWYVSTGDGAWGWLAHAQGKWLLTRETPLDPANVPSWDDVAPGHRVTLPGTSASWVVQERGTSRVVSAQGELPYPVDPQGRDAYADLVAPGGGFATLALGGGGEAARLFVGRELPEASVSWEQGAAPVSQPAVSVARLQCPSCGGPVPLLTADKAERAVCGSCNALLDVERGAFRFVEQLQQRRVEPYIPLGSRGKLGGVEWTVIGFMERYCVVQGVSYAWREYLLHDEQHGFRFLMEENGHWTLVGTISAADVGEGFGAVTWRDPKGKSRRLRRFSANVANVGYVVGEFYWKVSLGEAVLATDYVDPPYVVSKEESENEVSWSAGAYLEPTEVWRAFALSGSPPARSGVGTTQPGRPWGLAAIAAVTITLLLCVVTGIAAGARPERVYVDGPIALGRGSLPAVAGTSPVLDPTDAYFTQPFRIEEESSLSVRMRTTGLDNGWAALALALVNDSTGDVYEAELETEYYHGYEGGEHWTEGSTTASERIAHVTPGWYVLRIDPEWSQAAGQPTATLRIETAGPAPGCFVCSVLLLWLPAIVIFFRSRSFETRRWYNANP